MRVVAVVMVGWRDGGGGRSVGEVLGRELRPNLPFKAERADQREEEEIG